MSENKFGVCYCELNEYVVEPKIEDLVIFDTYEEAYNEYMRRNNSDDNPHWIPDNLWLVWIETARNRIVQFDRLHWKTKCHLVELDDIEI